MQMMPWGQHEATAEKTSPPDGRFGGTVDNVRAAKMAATIAITACLRFGSHVSSGD
jgi:hypothetical protein